MLFFKKYLITVMFCLLVLGGTWTGQLFRSINTKLRQYSGFLITLKKVIQKYLVILQVSPTQPR